MSSSWPRRPRAWAAGVAAACLCGLTVASQPSAVASVPADGPVVTVQSSGSTADPRVRLVADSGVRDPRTIRPRDLSVAASGGELSSRSVPLLSRSSQVAVVVDTTAAASNGLPDVRTGVTDLLLQLPPGARVGVVSAGERPRLLAPVGAEPTSALARLSDLEASGGADGGGAGRAAAAALTLATDALGPDLGPAQPRVLVLQTTAADAGGESATALGERLRASSVVLQVVTGASGSAFWGQVARVTGGQVDPAGAARGSDAFTRVADAL